MYKICSTVFCLFFVIFITSCKKEEQSYSEQKQHERDIISNFLERHVVMTVGNDTLLNLGKINVISEEQFDLQNRLTNVENNEFVLFSSTGVYMQIVREGVGERIKSGENRRLMCRFWEYNIMGDSLQLTNWKPSFALAQNPEYLNVSNNSGYISASFDTSVSTGSLMYSTYGDSNVPDGWLKSLEFVRTGAQTNDVSRIAKVRLIVPHSSGQSHASSSVYPCFYELTFQEDL